MNLIKNVFYFFRKTENKVATFTILAIIIYESFNYLTKTESITASKLFDYVILYGLYQFHYARGRSIEWQKKTESVLQNIMTELKVSGKNFYTIIRNVKDGIKRTEEELEKKIYRESHTTNEKIESLSNRIINETAIIHKNLKKNGQYFREVELRLEKTELELKKKRNEN